MHYTDDPIADFEYYDAKREKSLDDLPECCECGESIQDDCCYEFDDGYICEECLNENHRRWTENCIGA